VKVYVTANIIAHNEDLDGIRKYFEELREMKPDALIIADPGVFQIAKEVCPDIMRHISTQANNTNYETLKFWYDLGATRVVVARELTLEEIKEIRRNIPEGMEIEVFIHGAMCISYSGRCLLSNYMANRDANRGACTHPCRWKYNIVEEARPGEFMPVYENERGTFIFNSKDLCMIKHIPELMETGADSFKVEGRMKNALYVATVARTYRKAIDDYLQGIEVYKDNMPWYLEQIANCTYRHFTTGFFFGNQDERAQIYDNSTYERNYIYLGIVEKVSAGDAKLTEEVEYKSGISTISSNDHNKGITGKWQVEIEQRNKFSVGELIEIMKPGGENVETLVLQIIDKEGEEQRSAPHPQQRLVVTLDKEASQYDILRKKSD
jgi:putative protease